MLKPFRYSGDTQTMSATATSSEITGLNANVSQIKVYNKGPNTVFIRWGTVAQTAVATTDMPVGSGVTEVFTKDGATRLAAICAATETATVYVTPGEGA